MCNPGACGSVMPFELYELLDLGPLKKSDEVFTMVDSSIMAVAGIAENVLVKIGELTIPANFDVIRTSRGDKGGKPLKLGNVIEIFHPSRPPTPQRKSAQQIQVSNEEVRGDNTLVKIEDKETEDPKENITIINAHQGFNKQVMEDAYLYGQGYTPWKPPPYQHHSPQYNAYQSNGYGDAYYGYEDPSPRYPPSQNGIGEALQLLCQERNELWKAQKGIDDN
ncbi:hypothetical protein PIB30_058390 [Stylosanthes scabra]|uniref:Uncharacterized protein n=1 Tax=Stylosanthes scabra TaxID=79078 RepID=A0ABU6ZIP4_9FABA|nr:hypothetical protein [Stylosanthes scabra]